MKRSAINQILYQTQEFFSTHHCYLPPFARFSVEMWRKTDKKVWQQALHLKPRRDVTAFGGNDFIRQRLTLFTLRNGSANGIPVAKNYACPPCTDNTSAFSLAQMRRYYSSWWREFNY